MPRHLMRRHLTAAVLAALILTLGSIGSGAWATAEAVSSDPHYESRSAVLTRGGPALSSRTLAIDGVFGIDDREAVATTTAQPWSMTVFLLAEWPSGNVTSCSGFMVGAHTVGTAGHCVYDSSEGGWPDRVAVVPGANGDIEPFGRFWAATAHTIAGWSEDEDGRFDVGALTLDTDVGNDTGVFSMEVDTDASLLSGTFSILGYPGDKPLSTMWMSTGALDAVDEYFLYFQLDVTHGNSGGPIVGQTPDGQLFAVGIVSAGGPTTNVAVRMNQTVLDKLTGWRDGDQTTPDVPVTAPPTASATPGSMVATPSVLSGSAGEVALTRLVVGATEGGGDLTITTSGGAIAVDQLLSPTSCAGGTVPCVNETGNLTNEVRIPDLGNDLSTVALTIGGTLQVSKTVTVTAIQGAATWTTTLEIVVQAPAPAPSTTGPGTFDRTLASPGVNAVVWNGGTVAQLEAAVLQAQGVTATAFVGGRAVVLIPGAPAFVNASFIAAFPVEVASGTILLVVR